MRKTITIILLICILSTSLVFAYNQCQDEWLINTWCEDNVKLGSNCTTVDIYYSNWTLQENGRPLTYNGGEYFFNYNLNLTEVDTYTLSFCDNSTWASIEILDTSTEATSSISSFFLWNYWERILTWYAGY